MQTPSRMSVQQVIDHARLVTHTLQRFLLWYSTSLIASAQVLKPNHALKLWIPLLTMSSSVRQGGQCLGVAGLVVQDHVAEMRPRAGKWRRRGHPANCTAPWKFHPQDQPRLQGQPRWRTLRQRRAEWLGREVVEYHSRQLGSAVSVPAKCPTVSTFLVYHVAR
jgi:hypothetical protein